MNKSAITALEGAIEEVWDELQDVPSYAERFVPGDQAVLIVVEHCEGCGAWHNADDGCPQAVAA